MPDLLVPDLDPATYERLRQAAAEPASRWRKPHAICFVQGAVSDSVLHHLMIAFPPTGRIGLEAAQ